MAVRWKDEESGVCSRQCVAAAAVGRGGVGRIQRLQLLNEAVHDEE